MDPNATLARLRELVTEVHEAQTVEYAAALASEMAELFEAMDNWVSCGGFYPASWLTGDDKR